MHKIYAAISYIAACMHGDEGRYFSKVTSYIVNYYFRLIIASYNITFIIICVYYLGTGGCMQKTEPYEVPIHVIWCN